MTLITALQFPALSNYQDFENLCVDLFDLQTNNKPKRNGRNGQKQNGVDIVFWDDKRDGWVGIQSKCINSSLILEKYEINVEIEKAKQFMPPLKHLIIANTGLKDVNIEQYCREVSDIHRNNNLFTVEILNWHDLVGLLSDKQEVLKKYFPICRAVILNNTLTDKGLGWENSKFSFFKPEYIHPKIINELNSWISDIGLNVVGINLLDANKSNQFFGEIEVRNDSTANNPWIISIENKSWLTDSPKGYCQYQHIGVSASGIHIVHFLWNGGGSGIFHSIIFCVLQRDQGIQFIDSNPEIKSREIIKSLGRIELGDRYWGKLSYEGNKLKIRKDKNKRGCIKDDMIIEVI